MMILLIIILFSIFCCVLSSGTTGVVYYESQQNRRSFILPSSYFFQKKPNYTFIGHYINEFPNISESECLGKCLDSKHCLGVTYKPAVVDDNGEKKQSECSIQSHNFRTRSEFSEPWNLRPTVSYARIDPTKRIQQIPSTASLSTPTEIVNVNSFKECVESCLGRNDQCLSANYYRNTTSGTTGGKCAILMNPSTTYVKKDANSTFFYKKGDPGLPCANESGEECVYGLCKNQICLNRSVYPTGDRCLSDRECESGECLTIEVPYPTQKEEHDKLINDGNPDAIYCDSLKTCKECTTTPLPNDSGYSGKKCEWRTSTKYPDTQNLLTCQSTSDCLEGGGLECVDGKCKCTSTSCPTGCCDNNVCITTPQGGEAKCFSRKVDKTIFRCK